MTLLKNIKCEEELDSSKVNVTLIDTYIDNNCHFCDSSENIIPDSCENITRNTISLSDADHRAETQALSVIIWCADCEKWKLTV